MRTAYSGRAAANEKKGEFAKAVADHDMTGGHVPGSLEDDDRARRRYVSARVSPFGLVPPSAGGAVEGDTGFGADVERAIGGQRWPGR